MTKKQVALLALALVTAYAFGRFTAPTKVVTETKVVEVEKKSDNKSTDKDVKKSKKTTTTVVVRPDGTREETTVVIEDYDANSSSKEKSKSETDKSTDDKKEVTRQTGKTRISGLAGIKPFSTDAPVFGAHVSTQLIGPINVGAFGLSNGTLGVSLGLDF